MIQNIVYKEAFGVPLTPEKIKMIQLYTATLFKVKSVKVAIEKEGNDFTVIAVPIGIPEETLSSLYKKTEWSKKGKLKEWENYISMHFCSSAPFRFKKNMPKVPSINAEEVFKEFENVKE